MAGRNGSGQANEIYFLNESQKTVTFSEFEDELAISRRGHVAYTRSDQQG